MRYGLSATFECGAEEQTVEHVVLQCPIHRPPHGLHGLTVLDDNTIKWLINTLASPRSSAVRQLIERTDSNNDGDDDFSE